MSGIRELQKQDLYCFNTNSSHRTMTLRVIIAMLSFSLSGRYKSSTFDNKEQEEMVPIPQ